MTTQRDQEGAWMQPHWVGDLTLEANLEIAERRARCLGSVGADQGGAAASLHDRPGDRVGTS